MRLHSARLLAHARAAAHNYPPLHTTCTTHAQPRTHTTAIALTRAHPAPPLPLPDAAGPPGAAHPAERGVQGLAAAPGAGCGHTRAAAAGAAAAARHRPRAPAAAVRAGRGGRGGRAGRAEPGVHTLWHAAQGGGGVHRQGGAPCAEAVQGWCARRAPPPPAPHPPLSTRHAQGSGRGRGREGHSSSPASSSSSSACAGRSSAAAREHQCPQRQLCGSCCGRGARLWHGQWQQGPGIRCALAPGQARPPAAAARKQQQ